MADGSQDQALTAEKKKKLEEFFQHIISNAPVDFTSQEIQDIQNAVSTMLERIRTRVNSRGIFNIDRIVPSGSITEKLAIWKFNEGNHYLEFDFLAVLKNVIKQSENHISLQFCQGCIRLVTPLVESERLRQYYNRQYSNNGYEFIAKNLNSKDVISDLFLNEINCCLTSSCDCLCLRCDKDQNIGRLYSISLLPSSVEQRHGCGECTVDMPTGTLHVKTDINIKHDLFVHDPCQCSLILQWTSKAKTLSAPDKLLLQKPQPISSLPIYVDFLPALESLKPTSPGPGDEHDFFIVPKSCNVCYDHYGYNKCRWRKSWCMAEIYAITNKMSDKHRRCYQIMKYLVEVGWFRSLSNYHIKTAVLRHHTTCSNITDDCVDCVMETFRDLRQAYETEDLLSYQSNLNIFEGLSGLNDCTRDCERLITMLCSVSFTDSWENYICISEKRRYDRLTA